MLLLLELYTEFADQDLLVAVQLGDGIALAPHIFETGVDERDRAPDQIEVGCLQPLVLVNRLRGADQLRRDVVVGVAINEVRTQIGQPTGQCARKDL